jgi:RND family efflux transporter MFP subunit
MALAKKKKKRIILASVAVGVLAVAAIVGYQTVVMSAGPSYPMVETAVLEEKDLRNTVSVTGHVESTDKTKVFSRLNFPVEEVFVEVGDRVKAGDVLCQLDTRTLESNIARTKATLDRSQNNANANLADAQRDLTNARSNQNTDLDSTLIAAQTKVRNAEISLRAAENGVASADSALDRANIDLRSARNAFTDIRDTDVDHEHNDYIKARDAYKRAQTVSEDANNALKEAKSKVKDAEATLRDAQKDLERDMERAKENTRQSLQRAESSVNTARRSLDFTPDEIAIEDMLIDLEDCTITAPASGVVTAVYVEEGAAATGLMFVIEDTSSLKVITRVMEYDIASIKLGDAVEIRSDATGGNIYNGILTKIAPTSVKTQAGDSNTASDTEFETEIAVTGATDLKIGMKTRLNIIYEEKRGVFGVPYDAIVQNAEGEDIVFVARDDDNGDTFVHSVRVEPGMETDFETELSSDGLQAGDRVVTNPFGLEDGMQVTLSVFGRGMGGGMMRGPGGGMAVRMG